jgi:hypothetical protein
MSDLKHQYAQALAQVRRDPAEVTDVQLEVLRLQNPPFAKMVAAARDRHRLAGAYREKIAQAAAAEAYRKSSNLRRYMDGQGITPKKGAGVGVVRMDPKVR